ncbi:MAG: hypothetical protein JST43_03630 [Bacteroidetes bacterium]|nr:hypothetical protein [Bacteroidota bacterium]MBS1540182.1 hypothetical protein [Bacteroidota bacterium]
MKNTVFILFTGFLFCCSPAIRAQVDTVCFNGKESSLPVNSFLQYVSSPIDLPIDSVWHLFQQGVNTQRDMPVNFGPVNGYFWMTLVVKNITDRPQDLFLKIKQPQIYQVYFFQVKQKPELLHQAGLYFPFYSRPMPIRSFAFPVHCLAGGSYTALIKIHHINSLSVPVYLETSTELFSSNYLQNLEWGFWAGFISFCSLLALIGWIVMRRSVFVWYFLYMLSVVLFGLTDQGFSFQFFYPNHPEVSPSVLIDSGALLFAFLIKFTQSLLETKKYFKYCHRVINFIFLFVIIMVALSYIAPGFMFNFAPLLFPFLNVVILFSFGLITYIGIRSLSTNRIVAIFFLASCGLLAICAVFTILDVSFGMFNYFGPNPILISYIAEATLLSIAIAFFFRQLNIEKLKLAKQVVAQQKEMYQQYILGIEKERSRIAGELHDDVGSRLSYLKRLIVGQQELSSKTVGQLDVLIGDVRRLSHDLAPPMASVAGLVPLLEKLIAEQAKATGISIYFQVHQFQGGLNSFQIRQVYRIVQEALHNAIRHAQPSQINIQIFGHGNSIDVVIEDNGKGFDITNTSGFGLSQMKIRAESLSGRIEINSHPEKGTTLLVQVPMGNA